MNYEVIDKTFCGLQQRTKGKCATSEEMCQYSVNHFTKELSFKGNDKMQSYQGTPAPWKIRSDIIQTIKISGITSLLLLINTLSPILTCFLMMSL